MKNDKERQDQAEEQPTLTRSSWIGIISLILVIAISSLQSEGDPPAWIQELPGRINPPLSSPEHPLGSATLSGTVLSSEGHIVPDALVYTGTGELLTWEYSDADGRFSLEALPAGQVIVRVIGDGHEPQDFTRTAPLLDTRLSLSTPLSGAISLPALEMVKVTGSIMPPRSDWGLEGYELWLQPLRPPHEFGAPISSRATVQADRSVSFEELLAGSYRAHLLPPWARAGTWPNLLDPETALLSIGLAENSNFQLIMTAGEIEGRVTDQSGAPISEALVRLSPAGEPHQLWPPTRTDQDGHYALRDLPVGTYRLQSSAGASSAELVIQVTDSSISHADLSLGH
jgi:hypothetical protein